ncbi:MAG: hypothetical protein U9O50_06335 [Acidobacteriota bacterium]|nr:hypothetical protein [Acidobacteriota bacterium]
MRSATTVPPSSEVHCGGWEGLGKDGGGTGAVTDYTFIINLDYSRVEVAADVVARSKATWQSHHSTGRQIGSPEG